MELDRPSSSQIWAIRRCSTWSPPRNRAPKPLSGPILPVYRHRPAVLVDASPAPPPYHSWREYKGIAADCADFGRAGTEHHAFLHLLQSVMKHRVELHCRIAVDLDELDAGTTPGSIRGLQEESSGVFASKHDRE